MNYIKLLFDNSKINKNKIKKEWIEKNVPEYFQLLTLFEKKLNITPIKYSQIIFHYENNLIGYPKCELCDQPNKRFIGFESGYKLGCSRHCAILLTRPMSNETRRLNTIKKYGVDHTTQLKSVQDKMKSTTLLRYGVEYAVQNENVKNKIKVTNNIKYGCDLPLQNEKIKSKMIEDFIKKWGFDNPIKSPLIIEKIKQNSLNKYGTKWHISSTEVKNKIRKSQKSFHYNNIIKNYKDIENLKILSYDGNLIKMHCVDCGIDFKISSNLLYTRYIKNKIKICLNCNPLHNRISNSHREIIDFLKKLNIENIIVNSRKLIYPFEIDIYLPDYKIGIELNGIYWHSELLKDKDYHINKHKMCNNKGITLLQIWEDNWICKQNIIKSIILNKINKNKFIIGLRKCEIREVSNKDSISFLNENHVEGSSISSIRYGLYYKDELVSIITFLKMKKKNDEIFKITRFCNKTETSIVGSLSKLYSHFLKEISPVIVISYCDNDLFDGKSFSNIGMKFNGESINYWWADNNKRYNRWGSSKNKLINQGFDKNQTEKQIQYGKNWYRCYGSGNKEFIWIKTHINSHGN